MEFHNQYDTFGRQSKWLSAKQKYKIPCAMHTERSTDGDGGAQDELEEQRSKWWRAILGEWPQAEMEKHQCLQIGAKKIQGVYCTKSNRRAQNKALECGWQLSSACPSRKILMGGWFRVQNGIQEFETRPGSVNRNLEQQSIQRSTDWGVQCGPPMCNWWVQWHLP